jgi:hypothetical protein
MRTMAIPARPGAVERAYIVLPCTIPSLESASRFRTCNDEVRNDCLRTVNLQHLVPRDARHGRLSRWAELPLCCFKRVWMLFLALNIAFRPIDLNNTDNSLLLRRKMKGSAQFRILMPRILGLNNTATEISKKFRGAEMQMSSVQLRIQLSICPNV